MPRHIARNVTVLKPEDQYEAEASAARLHLEDILTKVRLAALAARGMGDDDCVPDTELLANWLSEISDEISEVLKRLSPIDITATQQELQRMTGGKS